jgi:hypothetical protein
VSKGHTCSYTRVVEEWDDADGKHWVRKQCAHCDNQVVDEG